MKSKVKVIFLFWTNGLSTSHHILIVHCASSKDSFSADHSSSLHSGAFTWLRFSASLKVLVWARRCQIYLSAPCGGCLCLQFPNAANLCESSLKVFQCHKPKILIQMNTWIFVQKTFNAMLVIPYLFDISKSKYAIVLVIEIFIVVLGSFQIMFDRFCPWGEGGYPPNPPKVFRQKYCSQRGEGAVPPSLSKKIPQKIGILGPKTLFLVPFNVM